VFFCLQKGKARGRRRIFVFNFLFIFKSKIINNIILFNLTRGRLMTLKSLRRDPSHQPAPVQSILDWRGAGSLFDYLHVMDQDVYDYLQRWKMEKVR
jgi:hypothetical protein